MLVVARLRPSGDEAAFVDGVKRVVAAFATRSGHVSTRLARGLEDPQQWVLVSEWADVGSYRRALSSYDVKMASGELMGAALPEPSAYEVVLGPD